ncbi:AraC-like ligand-binding domain-containing protein [Streptacidiphilus fuscans]|uniref:Helix-turn-helix domain-containing protein n=1 Tax=Streptacidiphilus fuscans TaxID=2789292 RepID=A0A931B0J4_9ACTN|nr:helix-turn-helix domain-containing protein [Streptacidiphilus fuscans]MBF9066706.1 helix-turn-helix domain-containing protein [Streptacidiphilus fuscans]
MPATISPVEEDRGERLPTSGTRSHFLTTRSVPEHESLEFWQDAVLDTLVGMDIRTESGTYDASMRTGVVGGLRITTVECDPGEVYRAPRFIARGDGGEIFVGLQCTGVAQVEQAGRTMELRAGDVGFFETVRPFRTRFPDPFQLKIFSVPRRLLCESEGDLPELVGRPLRQSDPLGGLVSPFLARLADTWDSYATPTAESLARGATDLLAAAAADRLGRRTDELPGAERVMLLRVQRYIRWNLSDPELSPPVIARAHGISVRYLHRLFEGQGRTLGQWVRDVRLQECRRALLAAPADTLGVARIARRWGFTSGAQLSRAFRSAYGLSPTDWLRQERDRTASPRTAAGPPIHHIAEPLNHPFAQPLSC